MSGDTPTAHYGMKMHNLECPDCSCDVFARETAHWTPDLAEHCAGCGADLRVALDEDPEDPEALTARVFVHEHGGEVVARLRAEVEGLHGQVAVLEQAGDASDKLAAIVDEAARKMEAHIERLTRELGAAIAGEAKAIADTACARASRDAAKARSRVLLARAAQAARERDDTFEALGFGPDLNRARAERDDARLHELHALARIASPGGHGTAAQAKIMAVERGWGYLFPEGSTVVEPAEMTVLREWAKTSMITVEEHEENRRVEALDDAKAAALLAGPTGGDQ